MWNTIGFRVEDGSGKGEPDLVVNPGKNQELMVLKEDSMQGAHGIYIVLGRSVEGDS